MAGHTPWREAKARRGPDTPERQAIRAAYRRAMEEALRLAELREAHSATQEVAAANGATGENHTETPERLAERIAQ